MPRSLPRIGLISALVLLAAVASASPAAASVSLYMPPETLARRADLVVEATVGAVDSGFDPRNPRLATYVSLDVDRVHRGPRGLRELVLRQPGGRWGGLVHEVDAVPAFRPGESVFLFLEAAADGSLRTVGMFFGKFELGSDRDTGSRRAVRDLQGQGRILGGPGLRAESFPVADLVALSATVDRPARETHRFLTRPPEWERLRWWKPVEDDPLPDSTVSSERLAFAPATGATSAGTRFAPLSSSSPTRWTQPDTGSPVGVNVQRAGNPLGDGSAAVAEIQRAMAAWTEVPESRLELALADGDYHFSGSSPAGNYSGTNIVLFGDPYDDISDPVNCSGVLAIGGYWRSGSTGAPVNNRVFHPALQLYVIFNDEFDCYLGDPDNLAEVAAHELGHGLGFGHSDVPDSIMRATAYGARGPRLGDDDRDAAHCHYPHALGLTSPAGGETFEAGSVQSVTWNASAEAGGDPGWLDLEYSDDNGSSWSSVAVVANDGFHGWVVPDTATTQGRLRLRRSNRVAPTPAPYPGACSSTAPSGAFSIEAATPVAGRIGGLTVAPDAGGVRLSWGPSCSTDADDYALYVGSLSALRAGNWDHVPAACSTAGNRSAVVPAGGPALYFLVAPTAGAHEGSLGAKTRPASTQACAPRESTSACY